MRNKLPTYVRRDVFTGPTAFIGSRLPFWIPFAKRWLRGKNRLLARLFVLAPGSRENYFHFLIGYLLPLVHAQDRNRFDKFLALDCGPLISPLLAETLDRCGWHFQLVSPDKIERPLAVKPWDRLDKPWKSPESVWEAVGMVRQAWQDYQCQNGNCPRSDNLMLQRSNPHAHYLDGTSESPGYGTSRRAVSNMRDVSDFLTRNKVPHAVYEPGAHCLGCQIETFTAARRLFGFRGAEWANLIWSDSKARVRMMDHDPPAKTLGRFMRQLGIRHEFVKVEGPRSPENPREALRFFTEE